MVILSCEGSEFGDDKPEAALRAMFDYASAEAECSHRTGASTWLRLGPERFPETAEWDEESDPDDGLPVLVDTTPLKGLAAWDWLANVGASTVPGADRDRRSAALGRLGERGDRDAVARQRGQHRFRRARGNNTSCPTRPSARRKKSSAAGSCTTVTIQRRRATPAGAPFPGAAVKIRDEAPQSRPPSRSAQFFAVRPVRPASRRTTSRPSEGCRL